MGQPTVEKNKVAIVFDNFGPYHVARMQAALKFSDVVAVEVSRRSAEYAWDSPDLPQGLPYVSLGLAAGAVPAQSDLETLFDEKLGSLQIDCIALPGWSSRVSLSLIAWCSRRSIPMICMSDSNAWDAKRRWPVEFIKKGVVRHFAAGLVAGTSHGNYLHSLGLDRKSIFLGYDVVDNDYFARSSQAIRQTAAMPVINNAAMPVEVKSRYFLASCRFVEKKNLPTLLESYAIFRRGRPQDPNDWPLVVLGDGELRSELEARRAALGLDAHVLMPGFRQYDELPLFYATAGALVHVSTVEQWGLVVNEAMASGLPGIVSYRCGCAEVLIEHDRNGLVVDPYDAEDIAAAMSRLTDDGLRQSFAVKAMEHVADWGPDRFGTGMRDAAVYAMRQPRVRPNLIDRQCLKMAISRLA